MFAGDLARARKDLLQLNLRMYLKMAENLGIVSDAIGDRARTKQQ